jgi:hypothetical protein
MIGLLLIFIILTNAYSHEHNNNNNNSNISSLDNNSNLTKVLQQQKQREKVVLNKVNENVNVKDIFTTKLYFGLNYTAVKEGVNSIFNFGQDSLKSIWSADYIQFFYSRIGLLIFSWLAQFLILFIPYCLIELIPRILRLIGLIYSNPKKFGSLTIDYFKNIYNQFTFEKISKTSKSNEYVYKT